MGTRSLTKVFDQSEELVCMYRQYDGYPSGHGKELADFLTNIKIVNGISIAETSRIANGMGCLAAQIIAHFKNGVGNIYIYPPKTKDVWEDYEYHISILKETTLGIACFEIRSPKKNLLFKGTPAKFLNWILTTESTNA
jgi:hypothetical protein